MELWQLDLVGRFHLKDGTELKCLTGIDDHSRYCVSARLMVRATARPVCAACKLALCTHGLPRQVLTDNGRVFTAGFSKGGSGAVRHDLCRQRHRPPVVQNPVVRAPRETPDQCGPEWGQIR